MKCMSLTTLLPFNLRPPQAIEQNAVADLFMCMEHRFGETCTKLKVKRNTVICAQGASLSCLYMIKQGEIMLTRLSANGRETLISILGPGEFFGEAALLSGTPITFSACATRRSLLLQLPQRKFKLLLDDPQACRTMLETIAGRCNDAWTQMEVLGCTHVRDKVRSGLLWLSGRFGVETREGVRIDFNQTQMARMVGCARETLTREVSALRRLRTIDVKYNNGRRSLFVVDPEGLSQPD
jgi:CRP/FNR family transcriptional regulator, cyclic AMP receptor protein